MSKFNELDTNISEKHFDSLKQRDTFELKCRVCHKKFKQTKGVILRSFKLGYTAGFCSRNCSNKFKINRVSTFCEECKKSIIVAKAQIKRYNHTFCSYSCNARYRNKNKNFGYIRSKIEVYIENKIKETFPKLELNPNERDLLSGLELDYYFPKLKLAIELNGITHYEPIYGVDRLTRSQDSDKRKMFLCAEKGVELAVINIAMFKNFSQKCRDVIWNEVNQLLSPLL